MSERWEVIGEASHRRLYIKVTPWKGKTCLYIMFISEKYFELYLAAVLKLYMGKASSGQLFGWWKGRKKFSWRGIA